MTLDFSVLKNEDLYSIVSIPIIGDIRVKKMLDHGEINALANVYINAYLFGVEVADEDGNFKEVKDGIGTTGFNPVLAQIMYEKTLLKFILDGVDENDLDELYGLLHSHNLLFEIFDRCSNCQEGFYIAERSIKLELSIELTVRNFFNQLLNRVPSVEDMDRIISELPNLIGGLGSTNGNISELIASLANGVKSKNQGIDKTLILWYNTCVVEIYGIKGRFYV